VPDSITIAIIVVVMLALLLPCSGESHGDEHATPEDLKGSTIPRSGRWPASAGPPPKLTATIVSRPLLLPVHFNLFPWLS
jgi:hypothetical protein